MGKTHPKGKKFHALLLLVAVFGTFLGAYALNSDQKNANDHSSQASNESSATLASVTEKLTEMKFNEVIKFKTTKVEDPSMAEGEEYVRTPGKNGRRDVTYGVVYVDGKETSRVVLTQKVLEKPVDEVKVVGTKKAQTLGAQTTQETDNKPVKVASEEPEPTEQTPVVPQKPQSKLMQRLSGTKYCIPIDEEPTSSRHTKVGEYIDSNCTVPYNP